MDELIHYGVKRRSGRYPWGSGKEPYQHGEDFLARVESLRGKGLSEKEICEALGMSSTDLRMQERVAKHERRALEADRAKSLREDGKSLGEITKIMGYKNDSSVRALLEESTAINKNRARNTAEMLEKQVKEKGMLDVGKGVEIELGCSANTLNEALFILETKGYNVYGIGIPQVTNPGKQTTTKILADKDVSYSDAYKYDKIGTVGDYHSIDSGLTYKPLQYPSSVDSKRISIAYGDKGGADKDGVIELRRGCVDLDLGASHYAQVRILVDGKYYMKGMAMYSDDIPAGKDIVFNTNKPSGTPMMEGKKGVLKPIKTDDPNNPFGAAIKANGQTEFLNKKTGKMELSPVNKLKEEGDWDRMSKNLSSQFLSKQDPKLIKQQLNLSYRDKAAEYDTIMKLTNPTLKKKMLLDFADECDGAAVHMKAAALPRQSTKVILPLSKLKENEVYAPTYKNGEKVALVRFPHGSTSEIPVLTVNNKSTYAKGILGNVRDAIGINPRVADRLSGADFDGDQVVVIPTGGKVKIKSTPQFEGLKGFDPKVAYPERTGMRYMTKANTPKQMGGISNLITDMTLKGADEKEIVRAIKHSMVVIDAEKHRLDYKASEKDQGIAELKKKYQGYTDPKTGKQVGGASTLLSRRKQDVLIDETRGSGRIDPVTGKRIYSQSGRTYVDPKTGKEVKAKRKSNLLLETDDLRKLSSGTTEENAYADYGNRMKSLANTARKNYLTTPNSKQNPTAKKLYKKEVDELDAALTLARSNAPRERKANAIANSKIKSMIDANPSLADDKKEIKKLKQLAITEARYVVGASGKATRIEITDKQWEAIQKGAVSGSKQAEIFKYCDADKLKERAMPRITNTLSVTKQNKAKAMQNSGYTYAEIAESLGVSPSTVSKYLK